MSTPLTLCWPVLHACAQGIVDQRLQESPENWRLVYKALLLLEYMVKHGPMVSFFGGGEECKGPLGSAAGSRQQRGWHREIGTGRVGTGQRSTAAPIDRRAAASSSWCLRASLVSFVPLPVPRSLCPRPCSATAGCHTWRSCGTGLSSRRPAGETRCASLPWCTPQQQQSDVATQDVSSAPQHLTPVMRTATRQQRPDPSCTPAVGLQHSHVGRRASAVCVHAAAPLAAEGPTLTLRRGRRARHMSCAA